MNKYFNRAVKKGLKDKDISMRELARNSGLDVSFLSKMLSGKRNPPSREEDIRKMAKALEIKPEILIFAAGRIPEKLIPFFMKEDTAESLLAGKIKKINTEEKKKPKKRTRTSKPPVRKPSPAGGDIDDTIL